MIFLKQSHLINEKKNVKNYYVQKKELSNWVFNHFYYKKVYSILPRNVKVVLPWQIEIFLFLLRFDLGCSRINSDIKD